MRVLCAGFIALVFCTLLAEPAMGQAGPFIDWIHKLSGPRYSKRVLFSLTLYDQHAMRVDMEAFRAADDALQSLRTARSEKFNLRQRTDALGRRLDRLGSLRGSAGDRLYPWQTAHRMNRQARAIAKNVDALARSGGLERYVPLTDSAIDSIIGMVESDLGRFSRPLFGRLNLHFLYARAEDKGVRIQSVQPTVELLLPVGQIEVPWINWQFRSPLEFGLEAGPAIHWFSGDLVQDFSRPSFLIQARAYPRPDFFVLLTPLRAAIGFHFFRPFRREDFLPALEIEDEAEGVEGVLTYKIDYDLLGLLCTGIKIRYLCR